MEEFKQKIKNLKISLDKIASEDELIKKHQVIIQLEALAMKSDFWAEATSAQETMRQLASLKDSVNKIEELQGNLQTLLELADLETKSEEKTINFEEEIAKISSEIEKLENLSFLSGPYDSGNALVSIHAGQGGVEAMDWAAMLERMYLRYADIKEWKTQILEETKGEEAGIKSTTIEVLGHQAYGLLKKEAGTHRLVRLSPFNADALRQTSFALVEILPVIPEAIKKEINPDEIEMETFRASGPGGQNVQKVNTAVRLRHKASGIVVTAQSERSQLQNRENALKLLAAKLFVIEEEKRAKEEKQLKGEFKLAGWGNQIRSYVLHPYKQVKDLRTGYTSSDPDDVLAGNLDELISAEIKHRPG